MRHLYLADNRLEDEVFDELALLPELRVLNLSYNNLYELPPRRLARWTHLDELYLSGNNLRSLPAEDLDEIISLRVLHINCNKFQVLPAELAKVQKLAIMDVGSNSLKYNVSNWPYDWNWNWNPHLKYLNMSGNTRLEIKHGNLPKGGRPEKDLTDFSALPKLRVLGLMDVTLRSTVPDQTEDRRVRTAGSQIAGGLVSYGMADSLGRNDHLSTMDMVVDRFRSHDDEVLIGLFDGQALPDGGSRIAKYLYEHFKHKFSEELERLRKPETALDAIRRTYLSLNKDIAIAALQTPEQRREVPVNAARSTPVIPDLGESDIASGCVATVLFIKEMTLFISNVGDATALLVDSEGNHKVITRKHDPTEPSERQRIRDAGGYVSRNGKLNDALSVSRAFGYIQHSPSVIAAPYISQVNITESHEMIILASRELWAYMSRDFAVDLARSERGDPMRAAQKLRDLAIAFGASTKIMVMIVGVDNLKKRERLQIRTPGMSMMPTALVDDYMLPIRAGGRRNKDAPNDSKLARLTPEVEPPVGQVSIVFTDIKNSTLLWGSYESEMRAAIKMHNDLMRRQLRLIGGYEVKTEGDSFMVSFPTVTSALLWAFIVQIQLLDVPWPNEILNCVHGAERCDADGNIVFRGLSVRMGIHWGTPVSEVDPVTKRMDYFGPMVNRSSRISGVADGGQICVSNDFIAEIQRLFETNFDMDRSGSFDSTDDAGVASAMTLMAAGGSAAAVPGGEDYMTQLIRRELRSLSSQGFEVKEKGLVPLKGLENPEHIFTIYPHALAGRFALQHQRFDAGLAAGGGAPGEARVRGEGGDDELAVGIDNVWDLYRAALRLESLCGALENPAAQEMITPERAFLERIREGGGEVSDRFLLNIVGNEIARIEVYPPLWTLLLLFLWVGTDDDAVVHQHARAAAHGPPVRHGGRGGRGADGGHLRRVGGADGGAARVQAAAGDRAGTDGVDDLVVRRKGGSCRDVERRRFWSLFGGGVGEAFKACDFLSGYCNARSFWVGCMDGFCTSRSD
jgi:adenylate cyclase